MSKTEVATRTWKPVKVTLYLRALVTDDYHEYMTDDDMLEAIRCNIEDEVFNLDTITQDGREPTGIEWGDA